VYSIYFKNAVGLARLYPFFGNAQADAETSVVREFYFFNFTKNQWHRKSFGQKARVLPYQENQVPNFG